MGQTKTYLIQTGNGSKGSYKTMYQTIHPDQADILYSGINLGKGYKKRMKIEETGEVLYRHTSLK